MGETYRDCDAAREIVPQMTMGPVLSEDGSGDGWGMGDLAEIASHTDNTIVTITKMGAEFIASTDLPKVNIFSPITTNLTSQKSTPTTMEGIIATPMARQLLTSGV